MPGMLTLAGNRVMEDDPEEVWEVVTDSPGLGAPDPTDPATLGCLEHLARQVIPAMELRPRKTLIGNEWFARWPSPKSEYDIEGASGETKAEVILVAWESVE